MNSSLHISVVIGFKNWGLNRLGLAIQSVQESFGSLAGEVIVSDYGSDRFEDTRKLAEGLGATYIYTATDGTWSRSRALNIGFAVAQGEIFACTDADMIFKPGSMERIYHAAKNDPEATILLECRDLPSEWSDKEIAEHGPDWALFDRIGKLRGRWGMGGMVAVTRNVFLKVRGLDERMHTYGCEDIDFGERTQRAGSKIVWLRDPNVRMFHMWHPPSGPAAEANPAELEVINANRRILYNDKSYTRNTTAWSCDGLSELPLVSIAIATRNRAKFLPDAIYSALAQTVQDFEIVVVDDGSTDDTERVVSSLGDPRIRYFKRDNQGIAAARNFAVQQARGRYIAVLDDDDIMLPWRLESQLASIGAGQHGSYGSFVNFDNETAKLTMFHEKQVSVTTAFERGGAPGHSTWMVETEMMRLIPYDESIVSGEDNNLFLRMLRSGVRLSHCKEILVLRRLHSEQMTRTDNKIHEDFAGFNRYLFRFNTPQISHVEVEKLGNAEPWVAVRGGETFANIVRPYLPDHLIQRTLLIDKSEISSEAQLEELRSLVDGLVDVTRFDGGRNVVSRTLLVRSATHATMSSLRQAGIDFEVQIEDGVGGSDLRRLDPVDLLDNELSAFVEECLPVGDRHETVAVLAVMAERDGIGDIRSAVQIYRNDVVVGSESYAAYTFTTPSVASAIEVTSGLRGRRDVIRLDILTNQAAKKVQDAARLVGSAK